MIEDDNMWKVQQGGELIIDDEGMLEAPATTAQEPL